MRFARAARRGVTLVAGPPCAGKNAYVSERRGPRDLVVDIDALRFALGSAGLHDTDGRAWVPFACVARDAVLQRLGQPHDLGHAWVITCAPRREQRSIIPGAAVLVLNTSADVCHARATAERPELWHDLIDEWFRDYEP